MIFVGKYNRTDDMILEIEKYNHLTCIYFQIQFEEFFMPMDDSVGHTICDLAHKKNAKNIVMGQRGFGVIRRTFLGSTSDYVVHHSHLPTIIIPVKEGN